MDAGTMGAIRNQLAADGLTTFVSQSWVFACPPLCITRDELLTGLKIIEKALAIADAKVKA
jgi:adenosylmethionine-8-amino-7-oxononanoate aminotransferase